MVFSGAHRSPVRSTSLIPVRSTSPIPVRST